MKDRDFQVFILQQAAEVYPRSALSISDKLFEHAPGETAAEKYSNLNDNLLVLQEAGYIAGAVTVSCDEKLSRNDAFRITHDGLAFLGHEGVCYSQTAEIRDAIFRQALALQSLSEHQQKTLKNKLSQLGLAQLGRLLDKGTDSLCSFLHQLFG